MNGNYIFVSYSRKDTERVNSIVKMLEDRGFSIWIDRDGIESGDAFTSVIRTAIEECKVVLYFSSNASNSSDWTAREIALANSRKKKIIPIKLDDSLYHQAIELYLILLDYVDLTDIEKNDAMLERLIRSLSIALGTEEEVLTNVDNLSSAKFYLKIKPNCDCHIFLYEEDKGIAKADTYTSIPLPVGDYDLTCISCITQEKIEFDVITIKDGDVLKKPMFKLNRSTEIKHKDFSGSANDVKSSNRQEIIDLLPRNISFTTDYGDTIDFTLMGTEYRAKKESFLKALANSTRNGGGLETAISTMVSPSIAVVGLLGKTILTRQKNKFDVDSFFKSKGIQIEETAKNYIIKVFNYQNLKYFKNLLN